MRVLKSPKATGQQLVIITDSQPGVVQILGAAGSGKTTAALLRLRALSRFWQRRREDGYLDEPPRILVLTYNRTLRGYIQALTEENIVGDVDLRVSTFGNWAHKLLGSPALTDERKILELGRHLGYPDRFLTNEVEYVLGRFLPGDLDSYADPSFRREGRGRSPQVSIPTRRRLLDDVIRPYRLWKEDEGLVDWNDEAVAVAMTRLVDPYHVVIADEAQDFSANQIRAVVNHLADEYSLTFVLDRAQRIYARHFTWREVGVTIRKSHTLNENYRNTAEIARFALPLVEGVDVGEDGTLPNFTSCKRSGGRLPILLAGKFSEQMDWVIADIEARGKECDDTVAFLHVAGWFDEVRRRLSDAGLAFCDITQRSEWPSGRENIALSTMHSAKGLEFDHVYIIGLSKENTTHGDDEGDDGFETYRRLLAMAIGRARETVTIGFKPGEQSDLIALLDPATFALIDCS